MEFGKKHVLDISWQLDNYKVFPDFIKEYLESDHASIKYIVTDDRTR